MSAQTPEPCALLLRESSRSAAPEALRTQEVTLLRPEAQRRLPYARTLGAQTWRGACVVALPRFSTRRL